MTDAPAPSDTPEQPAPDAQGGASTQAPTPGRIGATVIAVPVTGTPRAQLRNDVQELMARIEDVAAIRPPNPAATMTQAQIDAYVQGPFIAWVEQRVRATQDASRYAASLTNLGPVERGFAAALIAYAYEDMATSVRGMPLPPVLTRDPELMRLFQETIDRALLPIAEYAATGYDGCVRVFTDARAPGWEEWPSFCQTRLDDLREVFGRYANAPQP